MALGRWKLFLIRLHDSLNLHNFRLRKYPGGLYRAQCSCGLWISRKGREV